MDRKERHSLMDEKSALERAKEAMSESGQESTRAFKNVDHRLKMITGMLRSSD